MARRAAWGRRHTGPCRPASIRYPLAGSMQSSPGPIGVDAWTRCIAGEGLLTCRRPSQARPTSLSETSGAHANGPSAWGNFVRAGTACWSQKKTRIVDALRRAIPACEVRNLIAHGHWWQLDQDVQTITAGAGKYDRVSKGTSPFPLQTLTVQRPNSSNSKTLQAPEYCQPSWVKLSGGPPK
jgi:hypothetical protein